jgi:hypothetical protein
MMKKKGLYRIRKCAYHLPNTRRHLDFRVFLVTEVAYFSLKVMKYIFRSNYCFIV